LYDRLLAIEIMRLVVARACCQHAGAAAEWFASCCARCHGVSTAQRSDASFSLSFFRQPPDLVSVIPHLPKLEEKIEEKTSPTGVIPSPFGN
jgi:hypothetical protein